MVWFLLVACACFLWLLKSRVPALVLFFFFLTNGFQLIPVNWFDTGMGIQKGADFALIILMFFLATGSGRHISLLGRDPIARFIALFIAFVAVGIVYSKFFLGYDTMFVLRAARRFLFLLGYFVYRDLTLEEIERLIKTLLVVTVVQCLIFLLQLVLGVSLLNRQSDELMELSDRGAVGDWKRLYNIPEFTVLFLLYALLHDTMRKRWRIVVTVILGAALLSTLHRSWLSSFIITLTIILITRGSGILKKLALGMAVIAFALAPLLFPVLGERMDAGIDDFSNALSGGYDTHSNKFDDSFSFRIAHALERLDAISHDPAKIVFGLGFLTEDSGQSQYLNFSVGWRDKYGTRQIDTGDIAWSILFVWLGIVGTSLYLLMYLTMLRTMWKSRAIANAAIAGGYLLMCLFISFTSSVFIEATTFCAAGLFCAYVLGIKDRAKQYEMPLNTQQYFPNVAGALAHRSL